MRIGIVNDVVVSTTVLKKIVCDEGPHELAWIAYNGVEAVRKCKADTPDLILMDLIMPEMDGAEATRHIMEQCPCAILIVTASVSHNSSMVFQAMGAGALDVISTPSLAQEDRAVHIAALHDKINTIGRIIARDKNAGAQSTNQSSRAQRGILPPLVAIGCSTGGPAALTTILSKLPADFPAAIVIIQHVDVEFADGFASWLDEQTPLSVRIAKPGDRPTVGSILVAGTSDHLHMESGGQLQYTANPVDYVYRPSVDVFFKSAAQHWMTGMVGVLLTGMGRDGAEGLLALKKNNVYTIAQDEASCAVYGMPKAAVAINAACTILHINDMAAAIREAVNRILNKHNTKEKVL